MNLDLTQYCRYLTIIFAFIMFSLFTMSDSFSSLGVISLKALTDQANLIVYGIIENVNTEEKKLENNRTTTEGEIIISTSIATIRPKNIIKGQLEFQNFKISAIDNLEDSPKFKKNEKAIFFLMKNVGINTYSIIGLIQGKFDVKKGVVLRENITVDQFIHKIKNMNN